MRKARARSIFHPSKYPSMWLLAMAICLCPAAAGAGTLDPTDTATGTGALGGENGGSNNTADGYVALFNNTTGQANTASGGYALYNTTTGNFNAASGFTALYHNFSGSNNTASGYAATYSNSTGGNNTALGYQALYGNTGGSGNVAIGADTLYALTGSHNIALGVNAGKLTTSGNSNIYIGHPGINGGESNVTRIGQAQTKTFIAGIAKTPLSGASVVIKPDGQLGVVMSSARYKRDIAPLADIAGKLAQLRPVSFRYKTEPDATHYGLIAEEVDKVMPELVVRDERSRPESVQYQELIPLLLQQWKAQREINARQQAENVRLRAELAELHRTLATRLATLESGSRDSGAR